MDLHKHIAMPLDGPPDFFASQGKLALLIAAVARNILSAGVTTVRDVGDNTGVTFAVRDAINAGLVDGPRVIAAGRIISRTGGHGATKAAPGEVDYIAGGCDGPESCRRVVRENIEAGSDWIKVTVSGSGGEATGQRSAEPIMLPDEVSAVMSAARLAGRPVAAHAQSTAAINLALQLGARTIEHGVYFDDKSVSLFKANDAYLVPTAYVAEFVSKQIDKFAATPATPGRLDAKGLRQWTIDAMANPGRAYRAGIRLGVGSDSGSLDDAQATARELELYVAQGIPAGEAIKSATVINAQILGLADRLGRIRSGFAADLIAVKGDPLVDISQLRKVIFVMRGGEVKVEAPVLPR
jgi:imidazolonepropionase-like amidohydrolase